MQQRDFKIKPLIHKMSGTLCPYCGSYVCYPTTAWREACDYMDHLEEKCKVYKKLIGRQTNRRD